MYIHKKYIRLLAMASSVIVYSCYLSSNNQQFQESSYEHTEEDAFFEFKMFHFLVQEYAQMLIQGTDSEKVHQLIQEKFQEKPIFADKIWDKAQALAHQAPSQASYAFGEKKVS